MEHQQHNVDLGRRQLLHAAVYGTLLGTAVQAGIPFADAKSAGAPTDLSPEAALKKLL